MSTTFYSHGKLLITSEYLIVDGAMGLAVPCSRGQSLVVEEREQNFSKTKVSVVWESYTVDEELWFSSVFHIKRDDSRQEIQILAEDATDVEVAEKLMVLLTAGLALNPEAITRDTKVNTHLDFPQDWGLGSSSTLLANLAKWMKVDPFALFFKTTKGSGYDIACASTSSALLYQRNNDQPIVDRIVWTPPFSDQLYFVYLGKKQKSDQEVKAYSALQFDRKAAVKKATLLTQQILNSKSLSQFEELLLEHEHFLSEILERPTIKEEKFSDYNGVVKSLGAWGGDFVLVTARTGMEAYFERKSLEIIIPFSKLVF